MANYGFKQYNYANVSNYREKLQSNKTSMIELFNKYSNEIPRLDDIWKGSSGTASANEMQSLRQLYNGFINKVDEFISTLQLAENSFLTTERESSSQYSQK